MARKSLSPIQSGGLTINEGRILPSIGTTASGATITPTAASGELYTVTALAADAALAAPTGTPTNGQKLVIRIKASGGTRVITPNAIYRAIGVTISTSIPSGKTLYLGCMYNSADTKWDVLASNLEA